MAAPFLLETIQAGRQCHNIFIWISQRKNLEFCASKYIFQKQRWNEDYFKCTKMELITSWPALQEMLKEVFQIERKLYLMETGPVQKNKN